VYKFVAETVDDLYVECLRMIMHEGEMTHPRGFNCKELSPCVTVLTNPQNNILENPIRKASKAFMAAELLWMLTGRDDVAMISFYNSKIASYSDDGLKFFGAYGPKICAQLQYIVETLQKDPWSRQAVLNIWRENPPKTKDVPCTIALHFIRRPVDTLNLIVYMRSQDIWLGFPYDVHNFTCIQLLVASILGCKPGTFTLVQGSLHLYEPDFDKAKEAMLYKCMTAAKTPLATVICVDSYKNEIAFAKIAEEKIRNNNLWGYKRLDPLINSKMQWLVEFARKKYANS